MSWVRETWEGFAQSLISLLGADPDRKASEVLPNCIFTILGCTFLCLHLNIPAQYGPVRPKWDEWRPLLRQFKWGSVMIVVPELLVSFALGEWRFHRISHNICKSLATGNLRDWTSTHVHFANMGGLIVKLQKGGDEPQDRPPLRDNGNTVKRWQELLEEKFRQTTVDQLWEAVCRPFIICQIYWRWSVASTYKRKNPGPQHNADTAEDRGGATSDVPLQDMTLAIPVEDGARVTQEVGQIPTDESSTVVAAGPSSAFDGNEPVANTNGSRRSVDITDCLEGDSTQADIMPLLGSGDEAGAATTHSQQSMTQSPPNPPGNDVFVLHLNTTQLVMAQLLGIIDDVPSLSVETINDKNKVNLPLKLFSILKLLHFIYGITKLLSGHHHLTLIELATTAYVVCALMTYFLYWSKPQAVDIPEVVDMSTANCRAIRPTTTDDLRALEIFGGTSFVRRNFLPPFGADNKARDPNERIGSDVSVTKFAVFRKLHSALLDADVGGILAGVGLGCVHCLAWNYEFPSQFECFVWRAASMVITLSLIPYAAANAVFTSIYYENKTHTHAFQILCLYFLLFLYIVCRVFLLLAMLRAVLVERPG